MDNLKPKSIISSMSEDFIKLLTGLNEEEKQLKSKLELLQKNRTVLNQKQQ